MTVQIIVPLLVAVIGLLMYLMANGKAVEVGRILFWTGMLVTLFAFSNKAIHF